MSIVLKGSISNNLVSRTIIHIYSIASFCTSLPSQHIPKYLPRAYFNPSVGHPLPSKNHHYLRNCGHSQYSSLSAISTYESTGPTSPFSTATNSRQINTLLSVRMSTSLRRSVRLRSRLENDNDIIEKVDSSKKNPGACKESKPELRGRKRQRQSKTSTSDDSIIPKKKASRSKKINKTPESKQCQKRKEIEPKDKSKDLLLMDLGKLVKGILVKRPSATVRSPYVADVELLSDDGSKNKEPTIVQAHTPALDVGGLCSPGSIVFMTERPPGGKTSHSVELLQTAGPMSKGVVGGTKDIDSDKDLVLVGAHPRLGEVLAEKVLRNGLLKDVIGFGPVSDDDDGHDALVLNKQCTYGDSRVDFELKAKSGKMALIEVKNVVCSDFASEFAPKKNGKNHCVIIAPDTDEPYTRTAVFPWGRVGQTFEGKKVVSERAIKHLRNLVSTSSKNKNMQPVVLFVINRSDCENMRACHEACPTFASELGKVGKQGCLVVSFRVQWTVEGKAYFDGIVPVTL